MASATEYLGPGLFTSGVSRGLAVVLNNGDGTFGDAAIYDHAGLHVAGIAAADFNRDGLIDILTANGSDNTFSILFAAPQLASPLRTAEAFAVEDLIDPRETRPYLCQFLDAVQPRLRTQLGPKYKTGVRP